MPYAKKEDRASAVRKHYAKNKDEVLKTKVINRILQGKVPQARSLERFDITEDMVNEMRAEVGLEPIKIKVYPKKEMKSPDPSELPMPSAKLLGKVTLKDIEETYTKGEGGNNQHLIVFKRLFKNAGCEDDEDIAECLRTNKFLDHLKNYNNPNTLHTYLTAILNVVDTNDLLKKEFHEKYKKVFDDATQEKETFNIQKQLTDKVPSFTSIKKRIEKDFPAESDEVLMINLYNEITPRNDFDTLTFNKDDPNHIDLKAGTITLKKFKKTDKKYKPIENYKLSKKFMQMIKKSHDENPRDKVFTKQMKSIFKKTKTGVNEIRHSKISEELKGSKITDQDKREELRQKMLHSSATQLRYIRNLEK
jgi:hypothetical protein